MKDSYSDAELKSCLQSLGVEKGDCLFVHSSLKRLGKFVPALGQGDLDALLDIFLDTIGEAGTLVVPTFNFGFCKGQPFDRQNTPSDGMGAFSEYIRRQPPALRSQHPFQCVSAIGKFGRRDCRRPGTQRFLAGRCLRRDAELRM